MAGTIHRCYACSPLGVEFEGDKGKPVCAKGHTYPAVLTITLVHWIVPDPAGPVPGMYGSFRVACQPGRARLGGRFPASDQAAAVSCPLCQKTPGFAEALAAYREENGE